MARLSADKQVRLVSIPGLMLMLLVILTVLYLLIPRRAMFEDPALLSHPDALSIAYLRAVLRSDPQQHKIRLSLARQMLRLGRYQEAGEILEALPEEPASLGFAKLLLEAEIALRMLYAEGDQRHAEAIRRELTTRLQQFPMEKVAPGELQELLELGTRLGAGPDFMAWLHRTLATKDPSNAARWWAEAGRWALAAADPARASRDYLRGALAARDREQALDLANRAIDAALMAARPEEAFTLVDRFVRQWPEEGKLLRRGVEVALALSRHRAADRWNRRYLDDHPGDLAAWRDQRDISLALHDLEAAVEAAERIVSAGDASLEDRIQLARILEWSGKPYQALEQWKSIARYSGLEAHQAELARLSRMTLDLESELEALERLKRHRSLSEAETWRLALLYEQLGEPERASAVLKAYLAAHPGLRRFWEKRLALAADMGDYEAGLRILDKLERRFGRSDSLLRRKARLLWSAFREEEAWAVLKSLEAPLDTRDLYDLELYGELAWRQGDQPRALALYEHLYRQHRDGGLALYDDKGEPSRLLLLAYRRLILLAERAGDLELAIEVGRDGWRRLHDGELLLQAMRAAAKHERWSLLEELTRTALADPRMKPFAGRLLVLLADARQKQGRPGEAERLYRLALESAPESVEAKLGLLWLYIDGQRREALRPALERWHVEAEADRRYWGAFAAGWELLGEPQAALAWYRRQLPLANRDPLWLFNFADVLEAMERHADAWRIRRHALSLVQPAVLARLDPSRKIPETAKRTILALEKLAGRPFLEKGVERAALNRNLETLFIVSWELSRERDDRVRYWLARNHVRRLQLPAWQQMGLALLENDQARIGRLLEEGRLAPIDRVRGEERLGRYSLALAEALPLIRTGAPGDARLAATRLAAELFHRLPTSADLQAGWEEIGSLEIREQSVGGRLARNAFGLQLTLTQEQLYMPPSIYDLSGRDHELRLDGRIDWLGRKEELSAGLGIRRREDRTLLHALLGWRHRLSSRSQFHLALELNGLSRATQIVRADTAVDRLRLDWESTFTARTSLQLNLEHYRLESREGDGIAAGNLVGFSLLDKQMLGTNELGIRLQGTWLRNRLADSIPQEMAARMPPGSVIEGIIGSKYAALGMGVSLARGDPMARAPLVGGLRYRIDGWLGWEWPGNRPSASFSASLGSRLFGSDELALSYYYSSALNLATDQDSQGWRLQYRYFFGR